MRAYPPLLNHKLRGSILLLMLVLMIAMATLLITVLSKANRQIERDRITAAALAQAKDALIGYAVAFPEQHLLVSGKIVYVPGHLPCADQGTSIEGNEAAFCGGKGISAIGRLPWKTLGLPPLRDGAGECLWYAVSGSFKANTKPDLLNWDSDGQFQILAEDGMSIIAGTSDANFDGTHPAAVIFSAGSILPGQNRTLAASGVLECGGNYTASNYLDTLAGINNSIVNTVANTITRLISGKTSDTFNDRLLFITIDEIFARHIEKRNDFPGGYFNDTTLTKAALDNPADPINLTTIGLLQKTAQCLANYGKKNAAGLADKRLPWAAPLNVPDFANVTFDDDPNLLAGRPPFKVNDSDALTNNTLVSSGNNYRLLDTTTCPTGWSMVAGASSTSSQHGWWGKWKDHLFYAVAEAFNPSSVVASQIHPCNNLQSGGNCLWVDHGGVTGVKGPYAAVLIYGGKKLASPAQSRDTLAQKIVAANYLEGANATSISAGNGNNTFTKTIGNDVLLCVSQDLSIDPGCENPVF